jgi:hypothetical protein
LSVAFDFVFQPLNARSKSKATDKSVRPAEIDSTSGKKAEARQPEPEARLTILAPFWEKLPAYTLAVAKSLTLCYFL